MKDKNKKKSVRKEMKVKEGMEKAYA